MPSVGSIAGSVQMPPPWRGLSGAQVFSAISQPSSAGPCGTVLKTHLIAPVLASAAMPLAQVSTQRQREAELRRALREMRTAIDKFKDQVDAGNIAQSELEPGNEGYPPDLQTLVDGIPAANDATGRKLKFLRRVKMVQHNQDRQHQLK